MAEVSSAGFANDSVSVTIISETEQEVYTSSLSTLFSNDRGKHYKMLHRMRSKISEMERAQSYISEIYKETLQTMLHIMGGFNYINSQNEITPISCFHANPERAIAKIREKSNIILPVITVAQTISENSDERRRYMPMLTNNALWVDKKQRAQRVLGFIDRPVTIMYTVNIWSKYRADMDQIIEQIRFLFNPSIEVPTKFSTLVKANLAEESDSSETNVGDAADRLIRKELSIEVETYIPSPKFLVTSTGKIESFNVDAEVYTNKN